MMAVGGKMEEIKPLSDAEMDIMMCRLQGAVFDNNKEKINQIIKEAQNRVKELKKAGLWHGKD